MKTKKNLKYLVKSNNYVGLLFFALVLASLLYIIKNQTETFKEIEPTTNQLKINEKAPVEINEITSEIQELQNYLNLGDTNTFKLYQSSYIENEKVLSENISEETMLYIAYKYLEKTTDFTNYTKYITCEEAALTNLDSNIIQCGGTKNTLTYYTINTYITKELLQSTIQKIFNKRIINYTNFYTSEDNLCYYINDEYLCISHKVEDPTKYSKKDFLKAYKYDNKIEIIESYRYIDNGIYYKGFFSKTIGEGYYKSTFIKINGSYYWESTEYYEEN